MSVPFHADPFAQSAAASVRLNDFNRSHKRAKDATAVDALTLAIADGLRDAWSAHPDVFAPYLFDIGEAAAYLAEWIAARPR
jgi:hypothetical protein